LRVLGGVGERSSPGSLVFQGENRTTLPFSQGDRERWEEVEETRLCLEQFYDGIGTNSIDLAGIEILSGEKEEVRRFMCFLVSKREKFDKLWWWNFRAGPQGQQKKKPDGNGRG